MTSYFQTRTFLIPKIEAMRFETSNYTLGGSDPDMVMERWAEPSQTYLFGLSWAEECALELDSICYDEDRTNLSLLCTTYDPIPVPDASVDWQSEDGLQDTIMWEAATDCDVAAETMVSTDLEMLDYSADPAYVYYHYVEGPEEMDWEPCHCTDADNDIVMRDTS